ncbi:phage virion morphogenesis protein [Rhizobium herbae]|uniref:Phage virion morphogenesis protein n=1 Tax=Rhizobium herbae TaxID=508661 RepID=A0ABS4EW16_9HYPH|nr:phage virion morphogenesis protein [Rhizobium herbae]MBP1862155.1 phage virion morphogenesis protein [Rhizobium herbae]
MSGISYKTTVNDADMRAELTTLIDRMENKQGFYKNVGEHLLNSVGDNFDNEESPDGEKWAPLSPVTVARREAQGHGPTPILRFSGALRGSINLEASADDVRVGTAKVYGAMMHFGGESKGYMKATILARPYLGMGADDEQEIAAIAAEWLR